MDTTYSQRLDRILDSYKLHYPVLYDSNLDTLSTISAEDREKIVLISLLSAAARYERALNFMRHPDSK